MALPGLEPRGAAAITLSGAFDLTLVATHLGLRRRDRLAQQAAICDQLPAEASVVVAGDFNEWSRRAGFEPFERRFRVHAPGKSFPAGVALAPLDRFAVSPHVEVRGTGVAREGLARRASDHLPVWCEITLGGGA